MPQFKSAGIWFNYYGDNMLWRWPWKREIWEDHGPYGRGYADLPAFHSTMYSKNFNSRREYWMHIGALEEMTRKYRVRSFNTIDVLTSWVRAAFPVDYIVILTEINIAAKDSSFWLKLPQHYRPHFLGDYVVLTCGSTNDVYRLCDSIPIDFAIAYGFSGGVLIEDNTEDTLKDEAEDWIPKDFVWGSTGT